MGQDCQAGFSTVVILDPLLQGGGQTVEMQVHDLDARTSQQMVIPTNCKQNVWGYMAIWVLCSHSSPSSVLCIYARAAVKEFTSVVLGHYLEGQLQWK